MTWRLHIISRLEQRVPRTQNPRAPWSADARRAGETLEKGVEVDFKLGFCSSLRNHILRLNNKKMYGKNQDVWSLLVSVLKPLYFFIIIFTLSKIHFKLVKRA